MSRFARPILTSLLMVCSPVVAMVGSSDDGNVSVAQSVVTIVSSHGNFCSGALIAPKLVLSAAHCVGPGASYKIVLYDAKRQPLLQDVRQVAAHPQFNMQGIVAHRASADVALLLLTAPLPNRVPSPISTPLEPLVSGNQFTVVGIGVSTRGDGKSGGVVRAASLVATGQPGRLQIRLVDPATNNKYEGRGACTGDSGGPVAQDQNGRAVIVGVVSWSTGPNNTAGCGGLTGVTPLTLYRPWIVQIANDWGVQL